MTTPTIDTPEFRKKLFAALYDTPAYTEFIDYINAFVVEAVKEQKEKDARICERYGSSYFARKIREQTP